ncbi:MAG: MBL fold metallo-hydrolase, partial [Gammaproteobacteria bacterium]|nr:MBL fold metallo-hydrolase [Gammaproteobacteria bacterium]
DYRFKDYKTIAGIPFARNFELYVNDQPNLLSTRWNTKVNPDFAEYTALPAGLERVAAAPTPSTDVELQEIEEGVFLVGASGTFVLFVEMDDHVVSIGGTAGVDERIKALREVVEDKPIRYGVLTHHHNDHLVGVPVYEAEGAEIFTVAQHEEVVRATAEDGDSLKLRLVEDKYVIDGGSRTVELHDIGPTPHSEHLLVAYLPDEGILFEADHFPNPLTGRYPPAQAVTKRLAEAIDELGLDVKTIVGAHSPRQASRDDLNKVLATRPVNRTTASL